MSKLIRFLRPYVGAIILVFILLFVQAMTDLALPEYMSHIVNVGIQQNGIDRPVPNVLRQESMEKICLLLPESSAQTFAEAYRVLDPESLTEKEWQDALKRYPLLSSVPLVEKRSDATISEELEQDLSQALALLSIVSQKDFTLPDLPAGTDLMALLQKMPAEQRALMLEQAKEKMSEVPDSMISQFAVAWIITEYETIGVDMTGIQRQYIFKTGGLMLLISLLCAASTILVGYFAARVSAGASKDIRLAAFSKIESFSSTEFDTFSTASLITRTTNDVQQIQMALVLLLRVLLFAPILGVGGVIKVLNSNSSMGWIIGLAVSILMVLIIVLYNIAVPRFKIIQKLVDRLNLVTREFLSGLMVIRAFNTQKYEEDRFDEANRDLTRVNLFVSRLMALTMPLMMLIMNGISLLIVWTGANQVDMGAMQVGDIMAFIQYTMQIIMSFLMLSMTFIMLPRASVSAQRVAEVLSTEPVIVDPEHPVDFDPNARGLVVFEHVYFRYPNAEADVLYDISLTARPGETTAIIGSTGCGKSTLVNLIPRFYDVTRGRVLVNGVDVRSVRQADLRRRIGYVAQKGVLFTGTIRDNIAYGNPDATDEEIREAATIAQAIDFIEASEDGFDTEIAQGGANVSGGQKQRLSIARALVRNPDIYIFDDAFSALDYRTDAALRRALRQKTKDATFIIVAQRIATIRNAEQIIVLDEGRIAGSGRHEELMQTCPVYREIALSQLSEKELAI